MNVDKIQGDTRPLSSCAPLSSWAQRRICRLGDGDPSLRSGWHNWI